MADPSPPDDLTRPVRDAALEPQSATGSDGRAAAAHSLPDQIAAAQFLAAQRAAGGTSPLGGRRSAWNACRPARVVPPGGAA